MLKLWVIWSLYPWLYELIVGEDILIAEWAQKKICDRLKWLLGMPNRNNVMAVGKDHNETIYLVAPIFDADVLMTIA